MTGDVLFDYAPPSSELRIDLGLPTDAAGRGVDLARRDEMVDQYRRLRPPWRGVGTVLSELGPQGLAERGERIVRLLQDDGVTYRVAGTDRELPWSLDPLPLLLDEDEWRALEPGLVQRAELLDRILADLYGPRRLLADGVIPPEIVYGHRGFLRDAQDMAHPGNRLLFLSAADLVRDEDHNWRVLSDRTQAPSGAGYAMENRTVISRALPDLYRGTGVHRIAPFFHTLRQALFEVGGRTSDTPRVVLLTSGAQSETAFDQAFLSALLGLPLVEGSDLTVRDGRVWQQSLDRLEPVDVILRRVDSEFCDPLELRPDSQLGVPGLLEAARLGSVAVVNGFGTGVLENPGLFPFLPQLARRLLDEELTLRSATTFWCGDPVARQHVLSRLDQLVVKPLSRTARHPSRFGWELSATDRDRLARLVQAQPWNWVGQEPLAMSTAPTLAGPALQPRPVSLRTFAVAGADAFQVMRGGLSRVGQDSEALVVSNSRGASSKDTWVLSSTAQHLDEEGHTTLAALAGPETVSAAVSPRIAEDLFWLGRYSERVESTVRLLRVIENRWRDLHPAPDPALAATLTTLLRALTSVTTTWPGFVGDGAGARLGDPAPELASLIGDDSRVGGLAHDLRRIRELATAVRDQLSPDTWTVLSGLDRSVRQLAPMRSIDSLTGPGAPVDLAGLLQAMLAFSGLVSESMVRDEGWFLLDAGRRLERALQVITLLQHSLSESRPPAVHELVVESVLVAAESIITHRRRYPAQAGIHTVVELLVLDPGNPRSVAFQLDRIRDDLGQTRASGEAMDAARRLPAAVAGRLAVALPPPRGSDPSATTEPSAEAYRDDVLVALSRAESELRTLYDLIDRAAFARAQPLRTFDPFAMPDAFDRAPAEGG
jgi:uncharacterized circularly permuted ATP-grasp superfamily protein/uncharacterized alpha-E superfamily protein